MIQVTVTMSLYIALKGEDITWPGGSHQLIGAHRLARKAGKRILPIWVGVVDANLLAATGQDCLSAPWRTILARCYGSPRFL
jgi:hypothetical protein